MCFWQVRANVRGGGWMRMLRAWELESAPGEVVTANVGVSGECGLLDGLPWRQRVAGLGRLPRLLMAAEAGLNGWLVRELRGLVLRGRPANERRSPRTIHKTHLLGLVRKWRRPNGGGETGTSRGRVAGAHLPSAAIPRAGCPL